MIQDRVNGSLNNRHCLMSAILGLSRSRV